MLTHDEHRLFLNRPGVEYRPGDRINALGLRGPLPERARRPRSFRVACFGDSSTFGLGLRLEETYPRRLGELLAARAGGYRSVEVINAGVIAFSVVQGERLFERLRDWQLDAVTLAYGAYNEHYLVPHSDSERLRVTTALSGKLHSAHVLLRDRLKTYQGLAGWFEATDLAWNAAGRLRPRVAPREFEAALARIVKHAQRLGIAVVLVSLPRRPGVEEGNPALDAYSRSIEDLTRALGTPLVDLREVFARDPQAAAGHFIDSIHLDARGNALLAERLAAQLEPVLGRSGQDLTPSLR